MNSSSTGLYNDSSSTGFFNGSSSTGSYNFSSTGSAGNSTTPDFDYSYNWFGATGLGTLITVGVAGLGFAAATLVLLNRLTKYATTNHPNAEVATVSARAKRIEAAQVAQAVKKAKTDVMITTNAAAAQRAATVKVVVDAVKEKVIAEEVAKAEAIATAKEQLIAEKAAKAEAIANAKEEADQAARDPEEGKALLLAEAIERVKAARIASSSASVSSIGLLGQRPSEIELQGEQKDALLARSYSPSFLGQQQV